MISSPSISNNSIKIILPLMLALMSCGSFKKASDESQPPTPPPVTTPPETQKQQLPEPEFLKVPISNDEALRQATGLSQWLRAGHHGQSVTIGILDNGFAGLSSATGKFLPAGLAVANAPIKNESISPHGTLLAEIVTALTSGSSTWSPSLPMPVIKLYNSNGYTNFANAVDQAINDHVDIILYSQVWEFGGNFDGKGFINAVVNKALRSGIVWINAAGNYAGSAWQGPVFTNQDLSASLPYQGRYIRMNVKQNETPVKITLAWNDFKDSTDWRTSKDLDLILLNDRGQTIAAGNKIQDGADHGNDPQYSSHAREVIVSNLNAGNYLLAVNVKSGNFDAYSKMRIAADGGEVTFQDFNDDASVMIPADNPYVVTIGANDNPLSSMGRNAAGSIKPDALAPSLIEFNQQLNTSGSSTAAAVAASVFAVYEGYCGKINWSKALQLIHSGALIKANAAGKVLALPATPQCFQ
jgi:hypothetical protein